MAIYAKGVRMLKWVLALGLTMSVTGFGSAFWMWLSEPAGQPPQTFETLSAARGRAGVLACQRVH